MKATTKCARNHAQAGRLYDVFIAPDRGFGQVRTPDGHSKKYLYRRYEEDFRIGQGNLINRVENCGTGTKTSKVWMEKLLKRAEEDES